MRFTRDHGILSAGIVGAITIVAALIGTDTINVNVSTNIARDEATAEVTAPTARAASASRRKRVSLVELMEADETSYLDDGDYGTQSIGGDPFESGVSMNVYPDEGGTPALEVHVKGRFDRVTGVVGIDGDAECIQNGAKVWIADDLDNEIWGPFEVDSRSQLDFSADLSDVVRMSFSQRPLETSNASCGYGETTAAWGDVYFESG